jgi:hypothetical protein
MKYLLTLFLVLAPTLAQAAPAHDKMSRKVSRKGKLPHIIRQFTTEDGVRVILIDNPEKAGWVFFECQNVVSIHPTKIENGIQTVTLTTNEPYTIVSLPPCVIHKFIVGENVPDYHPNW